MAKINTELQEKLEHLSKLPYTDYPFISLYLNVNAREYFDQNRLNDIFLKNGFRDFNEEFSKDNEKSKSLEKDIEKITQFLNNDVESWVHGVAVFACDKLGIFETFKSIMPFENSFIVDSFPHLKQLAFQADEYENALVVMIDSRYATVYTIKMGGAIQDRIDSEHVFHRYHKQGGWAQANHQRHIKDQREEHFREVAKIVSDLIDSENYDNVILIGQEHELENFKALLPKRVDARIIDSNSLQRRENIKEILETIVDDMNSSEHKKENEIVKTLVDRASMNDQATLGIQDTIDLANNGAVRILTMSKNFAMNGFKCGECIYVSKDQHKMGCPQCNGNLKNTDIVEEVVRLTLRNKGKIEIVEDKAAEVLNTHEGIGAYLRY